MESFKVIINKKVITCYPSETLLNASQRQFGGIFIGCKGGGCGLCKIKVSSGETADAGNWSKSALADEEYNRGYRLACQCKPVTNMTIETCRESNKIVRKSTTTK
ncbi:2Fe-2S iron-sulfur cluster binding domain-containing protein [Bacillus sp. Marseille-P3661]|uniref:2Fe-2S iron-sulfur cluster binding domain-containing protein n=1 Tax=Bacillus sp. Marseille-P3661 TaxID=1936234 RepID=UPI000C8509E6|nr:2Fe-2S iron-sulfur cluster binding domain-containing protein [Bacillus sp. Marseille-P3661]